MTVIDLIPEEDGVYSAPKTGVEKKKKVLKPIRWYVRWYNRVLSEWKATRFKRTIIKGAILTALVAGSIGYLAYSYSVWNNTWSFHIQTPVILQNFIRIDPRASKPVHTALVKTAQAKEETFEDKIRAAFGKHAPTFLKIAHAESGQNAGSKGWNCMYGDVSKACKEADRANAWSVDCGALQINVYGTKCPPELYDLDVNLQAAIGKFERQGFKAWSVCKNGTVQCR